jgi:hypothetical protein
MMSGYYEFSSPTDGEKINYSSNGRQVKGLDCYYGQPFVTLPFYLPFLFGVVWVCLSLTPVYFILFDWLRLPSYVMPVLDAILLATWMKKLIIIACVLWVGGFLMLFLAFFGLFVFIGGLIASGALIGIMNGYGLLLEPVQIQATDSFLLVHHKKHIKYHLWQRLTSFEVTHRSSGSIIIRFEQDELLNLSHLDLLPQLEKIVEEKTGRPAAMESDLGSSSK